MGRKTRKTPIQIMGTGTPIFPARQKRRQRSERLQVGPSPDKIAAVDEFRYWARMPSRAAALREATAAHAGFGRKGRLKVLPQLASLCTCRKNYARFRQFFSVPVSPDVPTAGVQHDAIGSEGMPR